MFGLSLRRALDRARHEGRGKIPSNRRIGIADIRSRVLHGIRFGAPPFRGLFDKRRGAGKV
jgi:hypothetical protein